MFRGERPNKLRASWFSPKSIEVEPFFNILWGRALHGCGGRKALPFPRKLRIRKIEKGDRLWAQRCRAKRERAQITI